MKTMTEHDTPRFVSEDDFHQGMRDQCQNIKEVMRVIGEMAHAINVQAEVIGCHRFVLEKFVPAPLLETAAKEYAQARREQLVLEQEAALLAVTPVSVNN
jgi:hypothetical protein